MRLRAEELGVTVPRLLVESALSGGGDVVREQAAENEFRHELRIELNHLQRAVGAIGVNINQIAKGVNATGELDAELAPALAYLRKVLRRTEEFCERWSMVR